MLEKAPNVAPDGFLVRCGIIISLALKVASRVKSDGLKAMLWCRVVLWENSKAGRVARWLWLWAGLRAVDRVRRWQCGWSERAVDK